MTISNLGRVAVTGLHFFGFLLTPVNVFCGPEIGPACGGKTVWVTRKWARFLVTQTLFFLRKAPPVFWYGEAWPGVSQT